MLSDALCVCVRVRVVEGTPGLTLNVAASLLSVHQRNFYCNIVF